MSPTRKIICALALLAGGAVAASPNQATAAVTTDCAAITICTLEELVNGRSIQIGDKIYDGWRIFDETEPGFRVLELGNATAPDYAQVVVEPTEVDPLHHTLRFDFGDEFVVPGGDVGSTLFVPLGYIVRTVDGAARIHENTLELTEFSFPDDGGRVFVSECAAVAGTIDGFSNEECDGFKSVVADNLFGAFSLEDSATYDPALPLLHVYNGLGATSRAGNAGAQLSEFVVEWSQLPVSVAEPGTVALYGLGLAGLGLARRRNRQTDAACGEMSCTCAAR